MTFTLALKACVPLTLALCLARVALRRKPALAHHVLGLGFLAVLLLPVAHAALPSWRVPVLPPAPTARLALPEPIDPPPNPAPINAAPFVRAPRMPIDPAPASSPGESLTLFWVLGVAALGLRGLVGGLSLGRLRTRGSVSILPNELLVDVDALVTRAGLRRSVELRRSHAPGPASALTWGLMRPVVLLPAESARWSAARLEAALLHEFAHARRGDATWSILAEVVCALCWFNPLAWIAARRMRESAELAADRAVLRCGVRPADYAAELLRIAAEYRPSPSLPAGVQAMNTPKIESRLHAVLSAGPRPSSLSPQQALLAGLAALAIVPVLAAFRPVSLQTQRSASEKTEALIRARNLGIATLMYGQDYDDRLPSAGSTKVAALQILPYARSLVRKTAPVLSDAEIFQSPTPGGRFLFNTTLAGHFTHRIESPAETIAWFETLPEAKALGAVAYVDGHAALVGVGQALFRQMRVRPAPQARRRSNEATLVPVASAEQRLIEARDRLVAAQAEVAAARQTAAAARRREILRQIDQQIVLRMERARRLDRLRSLETRAQELESLKTQIRQDIEYLEALRQYRRTLSQRSTP